MMRMLEVFAATFIRAFGITQPTDTQRRRAAWFIVGLMVLMIALVTGAGYAFYAALRR